MTFPTWLRMTTARRHVLSAAAWGGRAYRHRWSRRLRLAAAIGVIGIGGAVIGTMLFAHANAAVGPFRAEMSITPSIQGGTEVDIPPLGSLHLDSHDGPIHLKVNLGSLDQSRTEALIADPAAISSAGEHAVAGVRSGALRAGFRAFALRCLPRRA